MAPEQTTRRPTRRSALKIGALTLGTGLAAGAGLEAARASADAGHAPSASASSSPPADPPGYPVAPAGTTLARTLQLAPADRHGYRRLVHGAGEPTLPRGELLSRPARVTHRTPLLSLAQLTDTHVSDAQSPVRFDYMAQYVTLEKFDGEYQRDFAGVCRPWEMLTAHVAEAMVRAVNALAGGPVTGRPLDFTITTGDNADSAQTNEIDWHVALLDGGTVRPDSGDTSRWEGVGGTDDHHAYYWHPDAGTRDVYLRDHGFPTVPGLLDRCRAAFEARGLDTPWYAVFGNHDGLPYGMARHEPTITDVATGALQRTVLPPGATSALLDGLARADDAAVRTILTAGPARNVTADPRRRPASTAEIIATYLRSTGSPHGHGFTEANLRDGTAYYATTHAGVRCISLDTVNPAGYYQGSLDPAQFAWLERQLQASSSRYLDEHGRWVRSAGSDELVMIFSHHTSGTMTNDRGGSRVLGPALRDLLLRHPNVIAWVNGHRHVNDVTPHARPTGWAAGSGFWEISTASHIDWPQQARTVEVVDNGSSLSLFATVLDHAGTAAWPTKPTTPVELAALARELSVNDPHNSLHLNPGKAKPAGERKDRNVELFLDKPF